MLYKGAVGIHNPHTVKRNSGDFLKFTQQVDTDKDRTRVKRSWCLYPV